MTSDNSCSVEGCARDHYARSFCRMHYVRWQRHGDTTHGRIETRRGYVLTNAGRAAVGLRLRHVEVPL